MFTHHIWLWLLYSPMLTNIGFWLLYSPMFTHHIWFWSLCSSGIVRVLDDFGIDQNLRSFRLVTWLRHGLFGCYFFGGKFTCGLLVQPYHSNFLKHPMSTAFFGNIPRNLAPRYRMFFCFCFLLFRQICFVVFFSIFGSQEIQYVRRKKKKNVNGLAGDVRKQQESISKKRRGHLDVPAVKVRKIKRWLVLT